MALHFWNIPVVGSEANSNPLKTSFWALCFLTLGHLCRTSRATFIEPEVLFDTPPPNRLHLPPMP